MEGLKPSDYYFFNSFKTKWVAIIAIIPTAICDTLGKIVGAEKKAAIPIIATLIAWFVSSFVSLILWAATILNRYSSIADSTTDGIKLITYATCGTNAATI